MTGAIVAAIVVGSTGLLLLLFGYMIKFKGMAALIAGYDAAKVKDKQGLTNWVGSNVMQIGAIVCLQALISLVVWEKAGLWLHLSFAALIFGLTLRTAVKANRY